MDEPQSFSGICCVIGGGGFIGRPVVRKLLATGRSVLVIDRGPAPQDMPAGMTHMQGDYGDPAFLEAALTGVHEIIHLAYASVPKTSFEDPAADLLHNIPPALTLLETASRLQLKKIVLVSSGGTVYGQALSLPIEEDHPTDPISPYGITKLAIEKYAGMFHALKGLPAVMVRPGNAYGEEQVPYTGQGLVATVIASMLEGKEINLFGQTGGVRDYIHVEDIASGIIAALTDGQPGEAYNIGSGIGTSSRQIVDILAAHARAAGLDPQIISLPERRFDVGSNVLSFAKLRAHTGWQPEIELEDGLGRIWDHFVAARQSS